MEERTSHPDLKLKYYIVAWTVAHANIHSATLNNTLIYVLMFLGRVPYLCRGIPQADML